MGSLRADFWLAKSGCKKTVQQQQQDVAPTTHLKPLHCTFMPVAGERPCSFKMMAIPLIQLGIVGWSSW